ncbi:MAG: 50S ribosomal protein L25 [Lachnospiraceae bacterium]|nr:50S ribosomal protein L25 [Lachnospiraceae bacterium]
MSTLTVQNRDMNKKAKALRRQGQIIGVIYGRNMKDNIPFQVSASDAGSFMKSHKKGSQTTLVLDGKNIDVLLKDADFDPATHQYLSVDFQALTSDEKVSSTAPVVLINEDATKGYLSHNISEISYKALPSALVDKIEIDVAKLPVGTNLLVKDLDFAKIDGVQILTPEDACILHIAEHQKHGGEEAATETVAETTEV